MNEQSKTLIFESLGTASMCWNPRPTGVFDSSACEEVGNKLVAALEQGAQKTPTNNARDAIFSELSKRVARLEELTKHISGDHVRG